MITINQQRKFFNDFADGHLQFKDFGWGDFADISMEEATTYPLLWVSPQPVSISGNEISFNYIVAIADRVYKDRGAQETEVHSDTFQMALDLLATLDQQQDYDWELSDGQSAEPFTERWKDEVAGYLVNVTFKVAFDYNECQVPQIGPPEPPAASCPGVIVTVNGTLYANVSAGDSENVEIRDSNGELVGTIIDGVVVVPSAGADATAVLKNSAGTQISSTDIPSGDSQDITAPDATAVIKDSAGTTLKTEPIPSNVSENITINDSTAVLKNSANTTILTEPIRAEATENITIPDVSWTDSDLTPRTTAYGLPIVCTPAASPSGILFSGWPKGDQYTSYRSGDAGSRLQAGWNTYNEPAYPAYITKLNWDLGSTGWARLTSSDVKVNGVANNLRFVGVDGTQSFSSTGNKDYILIDKYSGLGLIRKPAIYTNSRTWNQAIDDGLALSVVVDGVTYDSFYLWSMEEQQAMFGTMFTAGGTNFIDPISLVTLMLVNFSPSDFIWTSTTSMNSAGANAQIVIANPQHVLFSAGKTNTYLPIFIFDARSLITL